MAIIGATELQPVNVVSNYLAGQETRRNALAQQQEMAMQQQQMAMQQRTAQREEESAAAESQQNELLRRTLAGGGGSRDLMQAGLFEPGIKLGEYETSQAEAAGKLQDRTMKQRQAMFGILSVARNPQTYQTARQIAEGMGLDLTGIPEEYPGEEAINTIEDSLLTPAERAERAAKQETVAVQKGQLGISRGQLALARDRLEFDRNKEATQPTAGGKPPVGYRVSATGDLEAIPGGPSDPAVIKRNMEAGRAAPVGSARTSEQERNTAYNTGRLLGSLASITRATTSDASAGAPNVVEAALLSSPFGILEPAANFARGPQRQIVANAQADLIDALLYLATGAAYNKEQLQAQRQSYLPNFTDKTAARDDKRARLKELIVAAKIRSGNAWTPELEERFRTYVGDLAAPSEGDVFAEADAILKGGQ
jgi:hypothetical protein